MIVQCKLCPKFCRIPSGKRGDCLGRVNIDGKLTSINYGHPCSVHIDPVEKKPLYHFLPGQKILSIASAGCILHCKNCQNWQISQANPEDIQSYNLPPSKVIDLCKRENSKMIAYTYTDPIAFYEYTLDTARLAKENNMKNVLVTCGYINKEPAKELYKYSDATNIDLKFINDDMYRKITSGSLKPVLDSLVLAKEMGLWVEVTNLLIPTLNDDDKDIHKLCKWIVKNLGPDVPVHFSRFYPQYKMQNLPPTSFATLEIAYLIAKAEGLKYVYVGNIRGNKYESTYGHETNELAIKRLGYKIIENNLDDNGRLANGEIIPGVWK